MGYVIVQQVLTWKEAYNNYGPKIEQAYYDKFGNSYSHWEELSHFVGSTILGDVEKAHKHLDTSNDVAHHKQSEGTWY